jgi:glycine cleavage system H protein
MNVPEGLRYSKDHEWVRVEGDVVWVGITDYAQDALGDVVYVETPAVGATMAAGQTFGEVESTKSVSELYAPVSGTVADTNADLAAEPDRLNSDPYGEGWICSITLADPAELDVLMNAADYQSFIAG